MSYLLLSSDYHPKSMIICLARAIAGCRQFSANKVGVLNDKSKADEITRRAWPCCVMKPALTKYQYVQDCISYRFNQTFKINYF